MRTQKYFPMTSSSTPVPLYFYLEKYLSPLQRDLDLSAHLSVLMNIFSQIFDLIKQSLFTDTDITKIPHLPKISKYYVCFINNISDPVLFFYRFYVPHKYIHGASIFYIYTQIMQRQCCASGMLENLVG